MRLIIGLGNPGLGFRNSRHNLGFKVVDELARRKKLSFKKDAFSKAYICGKRDFVLAKPYTFMNLCGFSVRKLKEKFKLSCKDILVICDDFNLPLGKIRLRRKGSSGGHKGLASIIEALQTEGFPRLRIGIDRPEEEPTSYVLSEFSKEEIPRVREAVLRASQCAEEWLTENIYRLMAKYN